MKGRQSELLSDARFNMAVGGPDLIKPELQAMEKFRNRGVHSVSWMVRVGFRPRKFEVIPGRRKQVNAWKGILYGRYPRLILSSAAFAVISSFNFAEIPQEGAGMSSGFGGPWTAIETTSEIGRMTLSFQSVQQLAELANSQPAPWHVGFTALHSEDLPRMLHSEVQLDALEWQEDPLETSRLEQDRHWMRSELEEVLAAP